MGEMKRAIEREREAWAEQMLEQTRMKSTLVIAAAIIAAIRLARDPDISRPSPRLTAVVSDSVNLARMILDRVGLTKSAEIRRIVETVVFSDRKPANPMSNSARSLFPRFTTSGRSGCCPGGRPSTHTGKLMEVLEPCSVATAVG
jgi:hypothetical protein